MPKASGTFNDFLSELDAEVEREEVEGLAGDKKVLADVARRILKLERDMTMSGSRITDAQRVERLAQFIAEQDFK